MSTTIRLFDAPSELVAKKASKSGTCDCCLLFADELFVFVWPTNPVDRAAFVFRTSDGYRGRYACRDCLETSEVWTRLRPHRVPGSAYSNFR